MKRFKDNKDGTVTDTRTGLMWVKDGNSEGCNNGQELNWKEAIRFCKKLKFIGHSDWRLPTVHELHSIVNYEKYNPAINRVFTNTQSGVYWSSTTYVYNTTYAWLVSFSYGGVHVFNKTYFYYIRPVRNLRKDK